jgi:hypothetical protein
MMHIIVSIKHFLNARVKYSGLGKIMYTFSTERMQISAPRQASVGRSSMQGSGKQKSAYVRRKMYTLIYPYPKYSSLFVWGGEKSLLKIYLAASWTDSSFSLSLAHERSLDSYHCCAGVNVKKSLFYSLQTAGQKYARVFVHSQFLEYNLILVMPNPQKHSWYIPLLNISLAWKNFWGTNNLAYFVPPSTTEKKSFIALTPGRSRWHTAVGLSKLFSSSITLRRISTFTLV